MLLLSFLSLFPLIVEAEIVTVTDEDNPIQTNVQEKTFLWNGRVYVFYSNGVNMAYKHRTNGTGWSSEIEIRPAVDGDRFSVCLEEDGINGYIHYASTIKTLTNENIYYRKAKIEIDGSFSWLADEQTIIWPDPIWYSSWTYNPYVATDSDGYPIIVASYYKPSNGGPALFKTGVRRSATKNGTWNTDLLYQWYCTADSDNPNFAWDINKIIPIQSRKFHVISVRVDGVNKDFYYNGASWSVNDDPLATTYASSSNQFLWSGVAENGNDVIHIVYNRYFDPKFFFQHRKWNSSGWFYISPNYEGDDAYEWINTVRPRLSLNSSDNTMRASWLEYPDANKIYYRDWNGTDWTNPIVWITETEDIIEHEDFNSIYSASNFYGITYITNATSKNIEFEHFPEIPGQLYLINITIYEDDSILSNLKLVKIDSSYYETNDRAWLSEGNHTLSFSPIGYDFFNWTVSGSVSVLNNQSQSTTLTVNGEGTLTLYLKPIFLTWFMRRTLMWLGLIGIFICILCPVVAFTKFKGKDLEGGAMWFLGVFVLGIPFIVAWLWG